MTDYPVFDDMLPEPPANDGKDLLGSDAHHDVADGGDHGAPPIADVPQLVIDPFEGSNA